MIHGGAGSLDNIKDAKVAVRYLEGIRTVLEHGRTILSAGGSALEAVEVSVGLLEDDPVFNAGCGSVLNEHGRVEMDAAIMNGADLRAGAVAAVSNITNPVHLARLIMAESEHVMLIGQGAMEFARQHGMPYAVDKYFHVPERIEQFQRARKGQQLALDHDSPDEQKYGTVGAVARDKAGHLAAATSTGGIVNKHVGRVGDSPIIGAGVFADDVSCAVSSTGYGEDFMRTVLAKTIADYIEFTHEDADKAVAYGMEYLVKKVNGRGGVIVIDSHGNCASGFTTKKMIHGWIERSGDTHCRF
ncbi:MAG: isoaspartyl peptidase/L-asparaginase [Gammaproteobacteria bacterium]|nr:isoaspartyl peptidase/L-asparaginase [Gammaproteobacteria bacterium]